MNREPDDDDLLARVLALIGRCVACSGKGDLDSKTECPKCRGIGYRVLDRGKWQALMQRLGV